MQADEPLGEGGHRRLWISTAPKELLMRCYPREVKNKVSSTCGGTGFLYPSNRNSSTALR